MKIGFTGSRVGLTKAQKQTLLERLQETASDSEFLHGGCIGADEQAAGMAGNLGYILIEFPSDLPHMRTRLISHETRSPRKPLARNDDIIRECELLFACPKETEEPKPAPGQGTWSTVRHARRFNRATIIIWPDGSREVTCDGGLL